MQQIHLSPGSFTNICVLFYAEETSLRPAFTGPPGPVGPVGPTGMNINRFPSVNTTENKARPQPNALGYTCMWIISVSWQCSDLWVGATLGEQVVRTQCLHAHFTKPLRSQTFQRRQTCRVNLPEECARGEARGTSTQPHEFSIRCKYVTK